VLIVTGFAFQLPSEELRRFDYLLKPLRPAELLRAVERKLAADSPPAAAPQ
jgi:two-component SAPR family response regulator